MLKSADISVWEVLVVLLGVFVAVTGIPTCNNEDCCSCSYSDGSGIVDLKTIGRTDKRPKFSANFSDVTYEFNPCYSFTDDRSSGNCSDVAACEVMPQAGGQAAHYSNLAIQQNCNFNFSNDQLSLIYNQVSPLTVKLLCSKNSDSFIPVSRSLFILSSTCACKNGCMVPEAQHGLSTGSKLCISFFVLLASYFIIGSLYLKAVKQATGLDLLPNRDFWTSLPGLVQDGVLFFVSPCITTGGDRLYRPVAQSSSYQSI